MEYSKKKYLEINISKTKYMEMSINPTMNDMYMVRVLAVILKRCAKFYLCKSK